jgi:hypothetical protein
MGGLSWGWSGFRAVRLATHEPSGERTTPFCIPQLSAVSAYEIAFFFAYIPPTIVKKARSQGRSDSGVAKRRGAPLTMCAQWSGGGGAAAFVLQPHPRPPCGATQGHSPRQEDVGCRRGRAVHGVARAPRRDSPDGSAGEGQGAERSLRTTAAAFRGEAGARELDGVRCRTAERGGRVVRVEERIRRQFGRRKLPPELPECDAGRADSPEPNARMMRGGDGGGPQ